MDERALIAELIRWVMGIPADRVTWHHVALVIGGLVVWVLPAAMRLYHFVQHLRFIRTATPEQLAAYTGKLPPPKPPSLGGPVVMLALLCLLGLTGRDANSAQIAAEGAPLRSSARHASWLRVAALLPVAASWWRLRSDT